MHNGELGRCSPGCSEKIWAVKGPAGDVSETYQPRDEAANMFAAGKLCIMRQTDGKVNQQQTTIRVAGMCSCDKK